MKDIYITKASGEREKFDTEKLLNSLLRSGTSRKTAEEVLSKIESQLKDGIHTKDIYRQAFEILHGDSKPVAIRYSVKKAVMELGPSGFPFEKFIAEIFKSEGYSTLTGQMVKGFCVQHEIDVVAWNQKKLLMCEAKFHNEPGVKSDLKVALYVKARFDDLKKMTFKYGKERNLDEGWLITNTKFSKTAIEYGSCQGGLVMVGWNYPPKGNLHDMILEAKLHPITCLTTINSREKKTLLEAGIVLCKTIIEKPSALDSLGMKDAEKDKVFEEIRGL